MPRRVTSRPARTQGADAAQHGSTSAAAPDEAAGRTDSYAPLTVTCSINSTQLAIRKKAMTAIKYRISRRRRLQDLLSRGRRRRMRRSCCCCTAFRASSHMFRDLIPLLADRFHIVAPDLPGFGQSDMPARSDFTYTSTTSPTIIDRFTEVDRLRSLRHLCLRLRRADRLSAGREASGAHHRDHLAERQRL